ncbi:Rrp15p-domain-containing protein [Scheffersomyces coipomensis]|uniref:Rrp15p-domain-containing protein n=1 Tax=Scheffersomyces coipomensis TaxID=1788519 RepID=UPI00315CF526
MVVALKKQKLNHSTKGKAAPITKAKVTIQEEESEEEEEEEQDDVEEEDDDEEIEEDDDEDLGSNDEVDVADVSSSEADSDEDDDDDDEDDSIPKLKKKKNLDDGSASFANAFTAIIGSKLKAHNRKDPILARNKITLKKLESDKLENKAKSALLNEKKQLQDQFRVRNLLPSANEPEKVREVLEHEKKLKKVAQKGVVRLFNAVLSTQIRTNQEISKEKVGKTKKEELMNEISKEKFLDLVQAAGDV